MCSFFVVVSLLFPFFVLVVSCLIICCSRVYILLCLSFPLFFFRCFGVSFFCRLCVGFNLFVCFEICCCAFLFRCWFLLVFIVLLLFHVSYFGSCFVYNVWLCCYVPLLLFVHDSCLLWFVSCLIFVGFNMLLCCYVSVFFCFFLCCCFVLF